MNNEKNEDGLEVTVARHRLKSLVRLHIYKCILVIPTGFFIIHYSLFIIHY
jgi:hypothetical protein